MKNIPINFSICSIPPPFTPQQCVQSKSLFSSFIKADPNVLKYLAVIDLPFFFSRHGARLFLFPSLLRGCMLIVRVPSALSCVSAHL